MLSSFDCSWSQADLVLWSLSRVILVPLLVLCAAPHNSPIIQDELIPVGLTGLLGLSNGFFGSLPMIIGPSTVKHSSRELAGNLLTLSYCSGLTLGSLFSYYLQGMLGLQSLPCTPEFKRIF